jgi:hypothetical protein
VLHLFSDPKMQRSHAGLSQLTVIEPWTSDDESGTAFQVLAHSSAFFHCGRWLVSKWKQINLVMTSGGRGEVKDSHQSENWN